MKRIILPIAIAFLAGLLINPLVSFAQSECGGFLCSETFLATTKPLIVDAGLTSTKTSSFTGSFYVTKGGNSVSVDETTANMQGASGQSAMVVDFGGAGITAMGSIFENGNATYLTVDDVRQVVTISNMPASDPHIVGALYSVGSVVHISNGE